MQEKYEQMTNEEIRNVIRVAIQISESEEEMMRKLRSELGNPEELDIASIDSYFPIDDIDREKIMKKGGLIRKDGAVVFVQMWGPKEGIIQI